MKSIRIHQNGNEDVLSIDDVPKPTPVAAEVLIKIKYSSLNHMDLWVREGIPGIGALPLTLGCDASGVIEEVGSEAGDFNKGDRVFIFPLVGCGECDNCKDGRENHCRQFKIFGEHINGVHTEFFCVDKKHVHKLHDDITFEQGAAFPLVYQTAWHMLVTNGGVKAGQTVLVMAAGSGVGTAAVQIAKHFGAKVIATAKADKHELLKKIGAAVVIDHYKEGISAAVKKATNNLGADIIIEHVGKAVWDECLKSLAWDGKLITCGATTGPNVSLDLRHIFIKQQKIIGSTMGTRAETILIHDLIADQKLTPVIAKIFPFEQVKEAHRFVKGSTHVGKVLLSW